MCLVLSWAFRSNVSLSPAFSVSDLTSSEFVHSNRTIWLDKFALSFVEQFLMILIQKSEFQSASFPCDLRDENGVGPKCRNSSISGRGETHAYIFAISENHVFLIRFFHFEFFDIPYPNFLAEFR